MISDVDTGKDHLSIRFSRGPTNGHIGLPLGTFSTQRFTSFY